MKVYFRQEQVANNTSYSPSAGKPALVMQSWQENFPDLEVVGFSPVSEEDLCLAHDPLYVRGVLDLTTPNGFGDYSRSVRDSLPYTTGSFAAAALNALHTGGASVSPTSGFHHAGYSWAHGFCTFNGLVVAAQLCAEAGAKSVGILDCDCHYGDGTDEIIKVLGLDYITHFTIGGMRMSHNEGKFLKALPILMEALQGVDVLLYQAGGDQHEEDPLGGWVSTEGMRLRDRIVFELCAQYGIPVAWNLAGGYQRPVSKVVALHTNTMQECLRVFAPVGEVVV